MHSSLLQTSLNNSRLAGVYLRTPLYMQNGTVRCIKQSCIIIELVKYEETVGQLHGTDL